MLGKHYDHKDIEAKWYQAWEENGLFKSEIDKDREPFTVVIPPPNVTGMLHMGHVLNNTIQDVLCRYKRMQGYNVCWVPGTDHAGIATQTMVEKNLREQGIKPEELSREAFLEHVWTWKEKYGGVIIQQLRKLGTSCDWDRERFTMDDGLSRAVTTFFKRLYDKGWVYRGKYIVNWCPALQTALSDDEVDRSEEDSHLWHIKYPLSDGSGHLVVATTRPETMLGDTGVAVNPNDERYQHLIGKTVTLPIVGREIPIFADDHVESEFGTGCVKVTPAHDKDDFEMGMTHNLEFIVILDKHAVMNENVPEAFRGLSRWDARKAVVAELERLGSLEKVVPHKMSIGRCYRTKDVIEPYISEQWFIKMDELAQRAMKTVADGRIKLYPERWVNTYNHWLGNIKDWCISRQLKWGHRIPVWYCNQCDGQTCDVEEVTTCSHCGSKDIFQDPDVLDTWASSWLWPFSVFGWPEKTADLDYYYPTTTLVTAADIIFFWVARMIMAGEEFMDDVPFSEVYFNGIVRDEQGRKMSKTLGNSPDPLDVIANYGADALRFTIVYNTPYGEDTRFSEKTCDQGRGFCTKIWNAVRFLQMTFEDVEADPNWRDKDQDLVGRWILSRLADTVKGVEEDMKSYRMAAAASRVYNFFWGEFCDWYVEFLKPVQKEASQEERAVMLGRTRFVVDACLRMLHPFMPFVTEELWNKLETRDEKEFLAAQRWPEIDASWMNPSTDQAVDMLRALITGIRAVRKSYALSFSAKFHLHVFADSESSSQVAEIETILLKLAGLEKLNILEKDEPPSGCTAVAVNNLSAYLDLRGHLDVDAELAKIDKKIAKLDKEAKSLNGRLSNEKFTAKAPAEVVDQARADLDELNRQIETLTQTKQDLEKLAKSGK